LVGGLMGKDPLLAAECAGAGTVGTATTAALAEACLALLRNDDAGMRQVGCGCVRAAHIVNDAVLARLEQILFTEDEWETTRNEAICIFGELGPPLLVPTLMRL